MSLGRVLVVFALFAALGGLSIWLADQPGTLVLNWRGFEVRTSFIIGLGGLVVLALVLVYGWRFVATLFKSPGELTSFLDRRRMRRGYGALSQGMVAVASGDGPAARRYAAQAHRLLDDPPLTLLLAAQAAQLEGDGQAAGRYFHEMLESPATAFLGLRGLYVQAKRAGDQEAALSYAGQALALKPATRWAAQAVFDGDAARGDWARALLTLDGMVKAKLADRETARRHRAALLTVQGLEAEQKAQETGGTDRQALLEAALAHGLEAVQLRPAFAPAVSLGGRACGALEKVRKGAKLIEAAWSLAPHPDMADAYAALVRDENGFDRLARIKQLAARNPDHVESHVAVARAAMGARDWGVARDALAPYTDDFPPVRICELMAEIEDGQYGNRGRAREWLSRALHGPRDAAWVCAGYRSRDWSPVCPANGVFDGLEWKVPDQTLEPVARLKETAPVVEKETKPLLPVEGRGADDIKAVETGLQHGQRVAQAGPDDEPSSDASAEAAGLLPAAVVVAPDDPGPDVEENRDAKRVGDETW